MRRSLREGCSALFLAALTCAGTAIGCADGTPDCDGKVCACSDIMCTCGESCDVDCGLDACETTCILSATCRTVAYREVIARCQETSICAVTEGAGSTYECTDDAVCQGYFEESGTVFCDARSDCNALRMGPNAEITCSGEASCEVRAQDGAAMRCADAASCTLTCDAACRLECAGSGPCTATCPAEAAPQTCADGTLACGPC